MEEKKTPQEWEIGVVEGLAQTNELQLLEMAQDSAVYLAAGLVVMKGMLFETDKIAEHMFGTIRQRIARVAVLLDALQLRYGDCSEEELAFLQHIDGCLEKE